MPWRKTLKDGEELVLVTSSKSGKPNAAVVLRIKYV
jgi:hypothetical protein